MKRSPMLVGLILVAPAAHASEWAGSNMSMQVSLNGIYCASGSMMLTIDGNTVYGSAVKVGGLAGKISKSGTVSFEGGRGAERMRFTGKMKGDIMRGSWMEALTGCGGTWKLQKIADTPPPAVTAPQPGSDEASIYMEDPDEANQTQEGDIIAIPAKPGPTEQP